MPRSELRVIHSEIKFLQDMGVQGFFLFEVGTRNTFFVKGNGTQESPFMVGAADIAPEIAGRMMYDFADLEPENPRQIYVVINGYKLRIFPGSVMPVQAYDSEDDSSFRLQVKILQQIDPKLAEKLFR